MARVRKPPKDIDERLDEALSETFPASDPVSIGRNDHPGKPDEPPPSRMSRRRTRTNNDR